MKIKDQVAVVTGAGRGIGRAIAERCAQEGTKVALVARTVAQINEVCTEIERQGGTAIAIPADVTDHAAVAAMARRVEDEFGAVDLLVNNAGSHMAIGPAWEADPSEWWTDVTVNLLGVFLCCREVVPGMVARRTGRVITLIGGGTDLPLPYASAYGTGKAAVMRFTECLAAELQEHGITVFAVRPGFVRTAMSEFHVHSQRSLRWFPHVKRRFERGEDVPPALAADLVVALASGRFDALTGRAVRVVDDQGMVERRMPEILDKDLYTLRMRVLPHQ